MKNSTLKNIGIFSTALFATASAVYMYSPVIGSHADSSATADVNVTVGDVMSLTLSTDALNLSTNPNSFVSGVVSATTSTNSQYGYTLTLEDVDNSSDMTHTNTSVDSKLTSDFTGKKTSSEMGENTWGFSLDTTNFYRIPVNGSAVALKRTTVPMATDSEDIAVTFGAKVGNITSGTYTDKVLFTMYVNGQDGKPTNPEDPSNPPDDPEEPGGTTSMQEFTCPLLENVGDSMVLKDARDGNEYTVKKLKDGNCWMTDNLRISNKTITPQDSNVTENFTIPASNISSFNGKISNSVYVDDTYGGYYTFLTATAGTGGRELTSGEAPSSICPKGWRLPTGGDNGEFTTLYNNYRTVAEITGEPHFTFPGYVDYGAVDIPGVKGIYWSSTSNGAGSAYDLYIDSEDITSYYTNFKSIGLPVRCIAIY